MQRTLLIPALTLVALTICSDVSAQNVTTLPNALDRRIIERTREILVSSGWGQTGDCERGSAVGIQCALMQATTELVGESVVRQPALNLITDVVRQVTVDRWGQFRSLTGYNNHSETTEDEVFAILDRALMAMDAGFAFTGTRSLGLGEEPSAAVTLADIDRDGDLDAVIANGRHWPSQNLIYLNSGTGAFTVERDLGVERLASYRVELADLDGDGDLDAAVANDRAPNLIFLNRGDGVFARAGTFGMSSKPTRDLAVGDLNGDGALDLFVLHRDGPSEICFNDGDARFDECRDFTGQHSAIKVALGDINEDGALDVVLANQYQSQNYVYLNDGTGTFVERRPFGTGADETLSVAIGDLDNDGHLDVVTGNYQQPGGVYYGNGRGDFTAGVQFGDGTDWTYRVIVADANGDGALDVLFANQRSSNRVFLNQGDGRTFMEIQFGSPSDDTYGLAVGDVNGDGVPDVVESNSMTINRVFLGRVLQR